MQKDSQSGSFRVSLNSNLYSKDAIFKCLYWYSADFECKIDIEGDYYIVDFFAKNNISEGEKSFFKEKFSSDIIDFNLRDIVAKETETIRNLLVAKAFSHGEFDETPPGEISDPVGYTP
jgi:His-Xaa-Ser system protein HxsD